MKYRLLMLFFTLPMLVFAKVKIHMSLPHFPSLSVSITDFGAQQSGLSTSAINTAIETVSHQGGGTVVIPQGTWTTGPIHLLSNVNLHLDEGAVLVFSRDVSLYAIRQTIYEGETSTRCESPISAENATNIAITGTGVIDGSGDRWRAVKRSKVTEAEWNGFIARGGYTDEEGKNWYPDSTSWKLRPVMVHLTSCECVLLQGVKFQNSPAWCLHPLMCKQLTVDGISVYNPTYAQNGDGIDLESCADVEVKNSTFDAGDDAICIKSGRNEEGRRRGIPSERIYIHDNQVLHGHGGVVIGSEMSGGVRNVWVKDCSFTGTDTGLRFKTTRGRGGVVEKIYMEGITMKNIVNEMITIDMFYFSKVDNRLHAVDVTTPVFRDIHISDITCDGAAKGYHLRGLPEMPIQNVTLKNIKTTNVPNEGDVANVEKLKKINVSIQ